jgi:hypothetical protein
LRRNRIIGSVHWRSLSDLFVIAGPVPAIHVLVAAARTWMPGTGLRQGFDQATTRRLAEALAKAARPGMTAFIYQAPFHGSPRRPLALAGN